MKLFVSVKKWRGVKSAADDFTIGDNAAQDNAAQANATQIIQQTPSELALKLTDSPNRLSIISLNGIKQTLLS